MSSVSLYLCLIDRLQQSRAMGKGAIAAVGHYADLAPVCTRRAFNFCAGPAMLDNDVMVKLWGEFLSYEGSGMSLLEMSQRDANGPVQNLIQAATSNLRELLHIPESHTVLLFQVRGCARINAR